AAILLTGLRRVKEGGGTKDVSKAISTTGTIELDFLERGLTVLATIANVAPMLGFLGTVIGMIAAFAAIEEAGQVEPTLVAAGIKVALITTAAGLTIAIPVHVAYNYFVTRIDALIADMEKGSEAVLDLIWRSQSREA
ncbi:MAG: MotA/TolQ/ExbB proton channel family protein, partial [Gemmatimonadota bacterium]